MVQNFQKTEVENEDVGYIMVSFNLCYVGIYLPKKTAFQLHLRVR